MFLLGAGATVDAGMPTVAQLTKELRNQLPIHHQEFGQIFNLIEARDPSIAENYERFFEWIKLLLDVHKEPFRNVIQTNIDESLIQVMADLSCVVGQEVARLLLSRKSEPNYLALLGNFLPPKGRLRVFTLNYDCCIEDACRAAGIETTTGFDPTNRQWNPSLFETKISGINVYKLHGSLRWFGTRDESLSEKNFQYAPVLMELSLEERQAFASNLTIWPHPELILGPGTKVQLDDPFRTLLHEFHESMQTVQCCVVIGYGYKDPHINTIIDQAIDKGVSVIGVDPDGPHGKYLAINGYRHLKSPAKNAFLEGLISSELSK